MLDFVLLLEILVEAEAPDRQDPDLVSLRIMRRALRVSCRQALLDGPGSTHPCLYQPHGGYCSPLHVQA